QKLVEHITGCSCKTTLNRTWSKSVSSNHQGTSQKTRESKVLVNIGGCTGNPSDSRQNSGHAKRASWSGGHRGKKFSSGKSLLRSGSSAANSTSQKIVSIGI